MKIFLIGNNYEEENYKSFEGVNILLINISRSDALFVGIIITLIISLVKFIIKIKMQRKENINIEYECMRFLFFCYCTLVISKVYFPISFDYSNDFIYKMPGIVLTPMGSILSMYKTFEFGEFLYQVIGNLVMLSPLAFFMLYFKVYDKGDAKSVMLLCLKVTLVIEFSQIILSLLIPNFRRVFDINDIALNTLGGLIGYYVFNFYLKVLTKRKVRI